MKFGFYLFILLLGPISEAAPGACDGPSFVRRIFGPKESPPQYLALTPDTYLQGQVDLIEFADDYKVMSVRDPVTGRYSFIDSNAMGSGKRDLKVLDEAPPGKPVKPFDDVDLIRLKREICNQLAKVSGRPEFKKMESLLSNRLIRERMLNNLVNSCALWMGGFMASVPAYLLLTSYRHQTRRHNFVLDHGDNFYMLLPFMGMIHNCYRNKGVKSFYAALTVGMGMNVFQEVNVGGQPISSWAGADFNPGRKHTDWTDFNTGNAAILAYALIGWSSESKWTSLTKMCEDRRRQ